MIHDDNEFLLIRRPLLEQTSVQEHQRARCLARKFNCDYISLNIHH